MNPYEHLWKTLKVTLQGMGKLFPQLTTAFNIVRDVMEEGEKIAFGKNEEDEQC